MRQVVPEQRADARPDMDESHQAALLIDFDNVTMGIRSNLGQELRNLLNSDIIRGKVAVQRAYADWRRYPQYIVPLSEASIDLIFAPAYGSSKKNATDIRLAIDALELVFIRPEIKTFILMSGDSDFSSLVLKLKEYGKYIIGVGIQESSSDLLVQNCDEYYSYSALSGLSKTGDQPLESHDPWALVEKAVSKMVERGDTMRSDRLKQVMLEIDPSFNDKEIGFTKFNRFVVEAASRGLLSIQKMENGQYGVAPGKGPGRAAKAEKPEKKAPRGRQVERRREREKPSERERQKPSERERQEPPKERAPTRRARPKLTMNAALELMDRALNMLLEGDAKSVRDSDVKRKLLELDPNFDEGELGYSKFSKFLQAAEEQGAVELTRGPNGNYHVGPRRAKRRSKQKAVEQGQVEGGAASTMQRIARFLFGPAKEDEPETATPKPPEPQAQPRPTERARRGRPAPTRGRKEERGSKEAAGAPASAGPRQGARRSEAERPGREERGARGDRAADRPQRGKRGERRHTGDGRRREGRGSRERREPESRRREATADPPTRGGKVEEVPADTKAEAATTPPVTKREIGTPSGSEVEKAAQSAQSAQPQSALPEREAARSGRDETEPGAEVAKPAPDVPRGGRGPEESAPAQEEQASEKTETVVAPASMPGAPRGTIRGRWGSRGRYRPSEAPPPILKGQRAPRGQGGHEGGEHKRSGGEGVIAHLRSYSGVGERTAEALFEAFGDDLFRVLDQEPDKVREVLPDRRAERVIEARRKELEAGAE